MKKSSTDSESYLDRIRSWARTKAHGPSPLTSDSRRSPVLPITNAPSATTATRAIFPLSKNSDASDVPPFPFTDANGLALQSSKPAASNAVVDNAIPDETATSAPPSEEEGQRAVVSQKKEKKNVAQRFYHTSKDIVLSSWINVLLVFVPIGIAAKAAGLDSTIIFAMNAVAIIPLAGLLSHATESVAKRMGDTVGALMNVTFGNAVELIIFIALAKNEIRIVQASLLGSILANLLLILGMCFLVGGLRFREQIYNSTVTQMSACLLSLSVMSLLLPTAFHASFDTSASDSADANVLKVSRGTSVVLLLVYLLYLVFQLKSHAYMYESTPQHIIDEESAPGPVAAWMDSSSSSDDSSSSSDSDGSSRSNTTARRIKRVMRGRRHRKLSAGSRDTDEQAKQSGKTSFASGANSPVAEKVGGPSGASLASDAPHRFGAIDNEDEADDESQHKPRRSRGGSFSEKFAEKFDRKQRKRDRKHRKRHGRKHRGEIPELVGVDQSAETEVKTEQDNFNEPRRVDFAVANDTKAQPTPKKTFGIGGLNLRPAMPMSFSQTVFSQPARSGSPQVGPSAPSGPVPRVRYGIRRTNSLPDRLNQQGQPQQQHARAPSMGIDPAGPPILTDSAPTTPEEEENISRTTAVLLLLISTGLVAVCAEFMVDAISDVVTKTSLGETFVGLIILPIVGNAAEHVTAVSVASKNKMDLAIGVAVGSSIQIALFVTPFVVLLGWIMDKEMSLYFTLFETVSLFVSAFIVNFLVLDGRSNYLEGALLCSAYVIIAVAAFFYPTTAEQSVLGGNAEAGSKMIRSLLGLD